MDLRFVDIKLQVPVIQLGCQCEHFTNVSTRKSPLCARTPCVVGPEDEVNVLLPRRSPAKPKLLAKPFMTFGSAKKDKEKKKAEKESKEAKAEASAAVSVAGSEKKKEKKEKAKLKLIKTSKNSEAEAEKSKVKDGECVYFTPRE